MSVHHGDCVAWLRAMPPASAHALITDPPYSSGGAFRADRAGATGAKYGRGDAANGVRSMADFHGDSRDARGYIAWSHLWLSGAYDALVDGAFVALFSDWRMLPTMTDAMQAGGFVWRGVAVWHKPNARPQRGRPASECEYIVWGSKGTMPADGPCHAGMHSESPPRDRAHQTEKPIGVLRALVRVVPRGGVVLDPFAGSGSLGVACALEDRGYLGCELSAHYADVAARRLADVRRQPAMFGDDT